MQYIIIYRSFETKSVVQTEFLENDDKPVTHARTVVQGYADSRKEAMLYTIHNASDMKEVFHSSAMPSTWHEMDTTLITE